MDSLEMKCEYRHPHGHAGYYTQKSAHTELQIRVCGTGLDFLWVETIFYHTGKSKRTVGSLCVPKDQLPELARLVQEAQTIEFPRKA